MQSSLRALLLFVLSFFFLAAGYFLFATCTLAADYQSDYKVEYFLSENENRLNTRVKFTISVTNFRNDVYVKQFAIGFPKNFTIRDIKASDDYGSIKPEIDVRNDVTRIALEFSNPNTGKNSQGNFYLEFNQDNLFNVNGNVWEVIIPTLESQQTKNYSISVHLPSGSNKKISIAKPKPSAVNGNTITWNHPATKTVYAVFGEIQHYQTELNYNLKNPGLVPAYTEIALPPDTLYQQIFIDSLQPQPVKVYSDQDGNYLARYNLKPKQELIVNFKGTISVYSKPRENLIPFVRDTLARQKSYLTSPISYWKIPASEEINSLKKDVKSVYQYVVKKLSYDYTKIETDNKRLGAEGALTNPKNAVCMEFTDLFVAVARSKGILAREIEGYGFSQDPKLRPISLIADILHSWPEYFDPVSQLWIPLDPTWENTSGIDYFSSFDLNHLVFAVHGKNPEYPAPAGTYKLKDSRDITITASNTSPVSKEQLILDYDPFPAKITSGKQKKVKFSLTNNGNSFAWLDKVSIETNNVSVSPQELNLGSLAPFEKKDYEFVLNSQQSKVKTQGSFSIILPQGKTLYSQFSVVPLYYEVSLGIALSAGFFAGISLLIILLKRLKNYANKPH